MLLKLIRAYLFNHDIELRFHFRDYIIAVDLNAEYMTTTAQKNGEEFSLACVIYGTEEKWNCRRRATRVAGNFFFAYPSPLLILSLPVKTTCT